ncbi:MAG TPA: TraR/DksA C4-type zinc finger protein [Gemmatimonadaceae bacterium]|nr:TraR/DksA C4-type zinc finger protein [Gemmatimonadaceae bacterium]
MHLTQQERDHLARRLHEERERIVGALAKFGKRASAEERKVEGHDSHTAFHVEHEPDAYNQALDSLELSRLSRELGEIDEARRRLESEPERFGHDERTGERIPFERLDLVPWARTCAEDPHKVATDIVAADSDVLRAYRNERYSG